MSGSQKMSIVEKKSSSEFGGIGKIQNHKGMI